MAKAARNLFGIEEGEFVSVKGSDGRLLSFTVDKAYVPDAQESQYCGYVTSDTHKLIYNGDNCRINKVEGITLGCDPEAFIFDQTNGDLISAKAFLNINSAGQVGHDGHMVELRPTHSESADAVTYNIYDLIKKADHVVTRNKGLERAILVARSGFQGRIAIAKHMGKRVYLHNAIATAGFHLHYGVPRSLLYKERHFVTCQLAKVMDYYVGIPSIIPEGSTDNIRRTTIGLAYGKPSEFRINGITIEYRTPGACLMTHPILTNGVLALGATVMEDALSRIRTVTNDFKNLNEIANNNDIKMIYPNVPYIMDLYKTICSPTTDYGKQHLSIIKDDVEKMVGYSARKVAIDNFFKHIDTQFSPNLVNNWRGYYDKQVGA
ncbi:MAG: hypothetical protein PVG39_18430 [Desulfobacteraceae bacterium]